MSIRKKALYAAMAATAVASLSTAYAAWDNGGTGVITFGSGNPGKIIFLDQVRPAEKNAGRGTDRFLYNSYALNSALYYVRNTIPAGSNPSTTYNAKRHGAIVTTINSEGPLVWSQISKSNGAPCRVNDPVCPSPGQVSASNACSYHKVKVTASGEAGFSSEQTISVAGAEVNNSIGAGVSLTKEWESGWQACQAEGSSHSCPAEMNLSYNAVNYATTENRSKFGWQKFKINASKFYFFNRYSDADKAFCVNKVKGDYQAGNLLTEPKMGGCVLKSTSIVPTWERYERMPIKNTASLPTNVPQCRTIKGS